ncbi:MAG: ribonuclease H-like domain-containing protein [Firmicutes bacterium]|nr:ribonuclease H-like domain-containing protein [Bacillota bacterium]
MKHIIETYDQNIYESAVWDFYFKDFRIGVLDIETTGLDLSRNKFILGGLFNCQTRQLHQILAECREEEAQTLSEYVKELAKLDVVVTYNGRHFDLPFLEKRMEVLTKAGKYLQQGDEQILRRLYDLDLFLVVQGHSPIKKLVPNLRQKTIENYMGLWETRTDEISGAESVNLYNHYEKTGDPAAEEKILLHNNDDVRQLTKLTRVISKCDLHRAMYSLGFPVGDLQVGRPVLRTGGLCIRGEQMTDRDHCIDYRGFALGEFPVETMFSSLDRSFEFRVPVVRSGPLTVIDLEAAGLPTEEFVKYPTCESGFLVIEDGKGIRHMEINHFTKAFIRRFQEEAL